VTACLWGVVVGVVSAMTGRECGVWGRVVKVGPGGPRWRAPLAGLPLTARPHTRCAAEVKAGIGLGRMMKELTFTRAHFWCLRSALS
jgi:hypothetical protein